MNVLNNNKFRFDNFNSKKIQRYLVTFSFIMKKELQILVLVALSLNIVASVKVGTHLPIRHYEPQLMQVGSKLLTLSNDMQTSTNIYEGNYTVVLNRLSLRNRADYTMIISSTGLQYSQMNFYIQRKLSSAVPKTVSGYMFYFEARYDTSFVSVRVSYVTFDKSLSDNKLLMSTGKPTNLVDLGGLNSWGSEVIYKQEVGHSLPHLNYRAFMIIPQLAIQRNPDSSLTPYFKISGRILNTTTSEMTLTLQYLTLDYATKNFIYWGFWYIDKSLFDFQNKRQIYIQQVHVEQPQSTITPQISQIVFDHIVFDSIIFGFFNGIKGNAIDFKFEENTPPNNKLRGIVEVIGSFPVIDLLAIYGYTLDCPSYITAPCGICPVNCRTCDVYPTFHCAQCQDNFVKSADQQSCICAPPLNIFNGICGIFPPGCEAGYLKPDGTAVCSICDISKYLILVGTSCQCKSGFQFDENNVCKDICGDGKVFISECDDGNTVSGDGCSSNCLKQNTGQFKCDFSTIPTTCSSQRVLKYEIRTIVKQENENTVVLTLKLPQRIYFPFPIKKQQFQPVSFGIKLKIILSSSPYQEQLIYDHQLVEVTPNKDLKIKFPYTFNLEGLKGQIILNYQKTQYKNQTQILDFTFTGDNYALKFDNHAITYKTFSNAMLAQTILIVLSLVIGLIAPKFIGLELILTLQLIYLSQLLIYDIKNWPFGFVMLKSLRYSTGSNELLQFTQYILINSIQKKMNNLKIHKIITENYNISFLFLVVGFLILLITFFLRNFKEAQIIDQIKHNSQLNQIKNSEVKQLVNKRKVEQLTFYYKVNEVSFFLSNQTSFWLLLPLMSALSAELLIPSFSFIFINGYSHNSLLVRTRAIIALISFTIIFLVALNNFRNLWLSLPSHNRLLERPEELTYKRLLFVYLCLMGCLIFFCNTVKLGVVHCSAVAMLLHIVFMVSLVRIHPYRQSLRVHTVSLLFNNAVLLVFLFVVNLINYVDGLDSLVILVLGYFVTVCCVFQILLTFVRLYYELRYGRELQIMIQDEREYERQQKELERLMKIKEHELRMQQQAKLKQSEEQKMREKNIYLFETQINEDRKEDLWRWLETREWDQKLKDAEYFKNYSEKPMKWMKGNDKAKFQEKMNEHKQKLEKEDQKRIQKKQNKDYIKIVKGLNQEIKQMKSKFLSNAKSKKKHISSFV